MFKGNLPVRVLQGPIINYFEHSNSEFTQELHIELKYGGLNRDISYDCQKRAITDIAAISGEKQITIYEPYIAFLWCLAYCSITHYRESAKEPLDSLNNPVILRAHQTLKYGLSLFDQWTPWDNGIPNPENYDLTIDPYIDEAGGAVVIACTFILLHEYSHHFLGHSMSVVSSKENLDELISDEYKADTCALEVLVKIIGKRSIGEDTTIIFGLVLGISSLLFKDKANWKSEKGYPDSSERVLSLLNELSELSLIVQPWTFGFFILVLWEAAYQGENLDMSPSNSRRDDYIYLLNYLRSKYHGQ